MNRVIACASEKLAWWHCDTGAGQSKSSGHQRGSRRAVPRSLVEALPPKECRHVPVVAVSLPLAENFGSAGNKKGLTEARPPLILPVGVDANRNISILWVFRQI